VDNAQSSTWKKCSRWPIGANLGRLRDADGSVAKAIMPGRIRAGPSYARDGHRGTISAAALSRTSGRALHLRSARSASASPRPAPSCCCFSTSCSAAIYFYEGAGPLSPRRPFFGRVRQGGRSFTRTIASRENPRSRFATRSATGIYAESVGNLYQSRGGHAQSFLGAGVLSSRRLRGRWLSADNSFERCQLLRTGSRGNADNVAHIGKRDPKRNRCGWPKAWPRLETMWKRRCRPIRCLIHSLRPVASGDNARMWGRAGVREILKLYETEIYGAFRDAPKVTGVSPKPTRRPARARPS